MKFSTSLILAMGTAAILPTTAIAARPVDISQPTCNVSAQMRKMAPNASSFTGQRSQKAIAINKKMSERLNAGRRLSMDPSFEIGPADSGVYDMDGPNGELWYYTRELTSEVIPHEYYDEYILTEYKFDIYNQNLELVGTVHDKMHYAADEVRVPGPASGIDLLPYVTQHYFNSDDLYEIVVSLAVNSTTPGENHYRSLVYSINGEKEDVTVFNPETEAEDRQISADKIVKSIDGMVGDVLDASTPDKEEIYMSFVIGHYSNIEIDWEKLYGDEEFDMEEGQKYWDAVSTNYMELVMKGKADADGNHPDVLRWEVPLLCQQGNGESTAIMFTFSRDGQAYAICPRYKEVYYNPYYSPIEDMTMREGNTFVIDLYKINGNGSELVKTTEIPVEKCDADDALFTYYGIGRLRYSSDVDFENYGTEDNPAYYITRTYYAISTDDESDFCYYVYNSDGKLVKTIFEHADSDIGLSQIEGQNPMHLFISWDDTAGYTYNFTDVVEGFHKKRTVQINYVLVGEDILLANTDLVAQPGEEGAYKIVFEMRYPTVDDYGNDVMRFAWFDSKGTFERMDNVNMGENVFYAMSYMYGPVLNPALFDNDATNQEYMVLIKRGTDPTGASSQSQEEMIIARPTASMEDLGQNLLHLEPGEKGSLRAIGVYPVHEDQQALFVTYLGDKGYTADFYFLPFDLSEIEEIAGAEESEDTLRYEGDVIYGDAEVTVYDAAGKRVACGDRSIDVSSLTSGIYVVVSGKSVKKLVK